MAEMSSTLTAESKKYASVAKDLHRQASSLLMALHSQSFANLTCMHAFMHQVLSCSVHASRCNLSGTEVQSCAGIDTKIYAHCCHSGHSTATVVGQEVLFLPDWMRFAVWSLQIAVS